MPTAALPGFRDFYPQEFAERAYVFGRWREVARRYAFTEYDGPPLESLDLYTRKSGEEIVQQLYHFRDQGERDVAMRPEMTPTFARMVGARARTLRIPVRWFSIPQLFRYERPQKGRLREHYQLNVDIVGEAPPAADAELLACAIDMVRVFGLTHEDIVARVSSRQLLNHYLATIGVNEDLLSGAYGVIDKIERQPENISAEQLRALGMPTKAADVILAIPRTALSDVRRVIESGSHPSPEALGLVAQFEEYLAYLSALGVGECVRFDLSIVRGLAYYTGIVFELFDRKGEFRAICGGGRYDNLLASLDGPDMMALGFGMGDVVLTELLRARGLLRAESPALDYWLAGADDTPLEDVMRRAAALRGAGHSVEYALRAQTISKQKKAAKALGAQHFIELPGHESNG